jgi:hypothetical protein
MECGFCAQEMTAAEVERHEEGEREFEAYERALRAGDDPIDSVEEVEIPDGVPPDATGLTMGDDGQFIIPTDWRAPMCSRCRVHMWLETVFYGLDGTWAYPLMCAYRDGTHGCPQSPVMAYSWALVLLRWFEPAEEEPNEDPSADPAYVEAVQLATALEAVLSTAEDDAAWSLAHDVFLIAREHGALWA